MSYYYNSSFFCMRIAKMYEKQHDCSLYVQGVTSWNQAVQNLMLKQTVKVDVAIVIFVRCSEHRVKLIVGWALTHLNHHWLQLVLLNEAIAVQIKFFEYTA